MSYFFPHGEFDSLYGLSGQHSGKARQVSKQSIIPAVEVEPPGCSYNPTFDSHQDSLAQAVAEEMQKAYKIELGPRPVPLTVMGEVVDEDDVSVYLLHSCTNYSSYLQC